MLHLIKIYISKTDVFTHISGIFFLFGAHCKSRLKIQYGHTENGVSVAFLIFGSELDGLAGKIFLYHKRNLEGYRVIKFTQIKTGQLADLFKSVNESVSVYEKLT